MRTKNVLKNLATAWLGQIVIVLCSFISRWVLVKILPIEYLGINGLFTNVLTILSFADLGLGLSIAYYLYEPLAKQDTGRIALIVRYYKKIYHTIGTVVLAVGLLLIPLLKYIIKDSTIPNIKFIYCLYIVNAAISYFNVHKVTLLEADQKRYIKTMYQNLFKILQIVVGILVLVITKDYIAYYSIQILATIAFNYTVSRSVDKMYPYLRDKVQEQDGVVIQHEIRSNMGAMVLHKFSSVIVSGTDNILISTFVNLATVGLYSNYAMIISNITNFVSQFFWSMSAGIGNFAASEDYKKKTSLFYTLLFLEFWIYGFCSICLFVLSTSFIRLWLGDEYALQQGIVLVLILNFYMQGMRKIILSFRDAEGLFKQDCYKAVLEAVINLVVSLYLVQRFGLIGTFIGTIVSTVTTCVWLEPLVLFRHGLQGGLWKYYIRYIRYFLEVMLAGAVTYGICGYIQGTGIAAFSIKIILCVLIPNVIFGILHIRDKEFKELWNRISKKL